MWWRKRKQDERSTGDSTTMREHEPTMMAVRPSAPSVATRLLLTLAGTAALIVGAFMDWLRPEHLKGTQLSWRFLGTPTTMQEPRLASSAGLIMIILGAVAIVGLAISNGWMTRLAGALAVVAFVLFAVSVQRSSLSIPSAIGAGAWLALGGAIIDIFAGFFGGRIRTRALKQHMHTT